MEEELIKIFNEYNITYIQMNDDMINKIYNLFKNDIFYNPENGDEYKFLGLYYENIKKDYEKAEKYYLMAIEKGNVDAMNNLGIYYYNIKKDYEKAEKYYLMAIEKGN